MNSGDSPETATFHNVKRRRQGYGRGRGHARPGAQVHLYAVQCEGFFKIGLASNLNARIASMQTGCPFPIVGRYYVMVRAELAGEAEWIAHEYLGEARVRGEWFRCSANKVRAALDRANSVLTDAVAEARHLARTASAPQKPPPPEFDEVFARAVNPVLGLPPGAV